LNVVTRKWRCIEERFRILSLTAVWQFRINFLDSGVDPWKFFWFTIKSFTAIESQHGIDWQLSHLLHFDNRIKYWERFLYFIFRILYRGVYLSAEIIYNTDKLYILFFLLQIFDNPIEIQVFRIEIKIQIFDISNIIVLCVYMLKDLFNRECIRFIIVIQLKMYQVYSLCKK